MRGTGGCGPEAEKQQEPDCNAASRVRADGLPGEWHAWDLGTTVRLEVTDEASSLLMHPAMAAANPPSWEECFLTDNI